MLLAILFLRAPGVFGQDPATTSGEIVVTGDRRSRPKSESPTRTEVIDRRYIEESGATTAAEVLGHHAGIEVRSGIRGRSIFLLGLDPRHVLILVDGERVAGRTDGAFDMTRIKAAEIERIEIVKGPSSALYGSDALAGVINIIRRKVQSPVVASAEMGHGSGRKYHFGSGGDSQASGSLALDGEKLSTSMVAGWRRSDGFDLTPFTARDAQALLLAPLLADLQTDPILLKQAGTSPGVSEVFVGNRATYRPSDSWLWKASGTYRHIQQDLLDGAPPRQLIDRSNETHDGSFAIGSEIKFGRTALLTTGYNYSRFLDVLSQDQRGAEDLDRTEVQDERVQEARLQWDYQIAGNQNLSVGSDFLFEELASPRLTEAYAFRQRPAVFAQHEWKLNLGLPVTLVPGARYEYDSWFGAQAAPKLAGRIEPGAGVLVRFGGGVGFRAPSFKEMFFDFVNAGVGYRVIGNPELKPERSNGYTAGLEQTIGKSWFWSVDLFYNSVSNLIDFQRVSGGPGEELAVYQPRNIRRALTGGGEALLEYSWSRQLVLGLGYGHTESRDLLREIPLEGRVRQRGLYSIRWTNAAKTVVLNLRGSVFGPQATWEPKVALYSINEQGQLVRDADAFNKALTERREVALFERDPLAPQQSVRYRNPHHNLDVSVTLRAWQRYELLLGVDNVLDDYEPSLNPQRPRFFYFAFRIRYEEGPRSERLRPRMEQGLPLPEPRS